MSNNDVFSLINAIDSISLLFVAGVGIYLTVRQLRQGYEIQKATFFKELYLALTSYTDIRKAVYMVEGKKFVFDQSFYGSPEEYLIDQMLSFFDLVCELYTRTMLTNQEMQFFKYQALTVYNDDGIQRYLEALGHDYKNIQIGSIPFPSFVSYCQKEMAMQKTSSK